MAFCRINFNGKRHGKKYKPRKGKRAKNYSRDEVAFGKKEKPLKRPFAKRRRGRYLTAWTDKPKLRAAKKYGKR